MRFLVMCKAGVWEAVVLPPNLLPKLSKSPRCLGLCFLLSLVASIVVMLVVARPAVLVARLVVDLVADLVMGLLEGPEASEAGVPP